MGEPLERVLCGDNSGYGSEAFSACDPRFHSKGVAKSVFIIHCGMEKMRRPSPSLLGLGFRRAKTNRDRDLGRLFDSPCVRTIVTGGPKSWISGGDSAPMSASEFKEAGGQLYFSSRPTPCRQPSASWLSPFSHEGISREAASSNYKLAGPAT